MGTGLTNSGGGSNVSDVTAVAADVLTGALFVDSGGVLTAGTMTNNGSVSGVISSKDDSITIAQGYHDGTGSVSIDSTERAKIIAANIKSGINLLGVNGSYSAPYTVTTGTFTVSSTSSSVTVNSLGFHPLAIGIEGDISGANMSSGTSIIRYFYGIVYGFSHPFGGGSYSGDLINHSSSYGYPPVILACRNYASYDQSYYITYEAARSNNAYYPTIELYTSGTKKGFKITRSTSTSWLAQSYTYYAIRQVT